MDWWIEGQGPRFSKPYWSLVLYGFCTSVVFFVYAYMWLLPVSREIPGIETRFPGSRFCVEIPVFVKQKKKIINSGISIQVSFN